MATPRTSVSPTTAWRVATGPTGSGDSAYFLRIIPDGSPFNELSGPERYTFSTSPWIGQLASASVDEVHQRVVLDLVQAESNQLLLKFFGSPESNPQPSFVSARVGVGAVWGISEASDGTDTEYIGEFLGRFQLTMGAVQAAGSAIFPPIAPGEPAIFGRRCTVVADRAMFPGFRAVGELPLSTGQDASERLISPSPVLAVDALGYTAMVVELRGRKLDGGVDSQGATELGVAYRTL